MYIFSTRIEWEPAWIVERRRIRRALRLEERARRRGRLVWASSQWGTYTRERS